MKIFFSAIFNRLQLPSVILFLQLLNFKNFIIWLFSKNKNTEIEEFNHKKVALIALYQKGNLRKDILNLIQQLKRKQYYVIGVNTLKLNPENLEYFDYFIERYNYGRDFGSYKDGFLEIFKLSKRSSLSPSVLMLNDSVFYSYKNIEKFLSELEITNEFDVIGATENFEIEHHYGSFCISFASSVIKNKKFINFWKNYNLSDMRPKVIKKGEMGLSKVIKKVAASSERIKAIYNIFSFREFLNSRPEIVANAHDYSRLSKHTGWKTFTFQEVHKSLVPYMQNILGVYGGGNDIKSDIDISKVPIYGVTDLRGYQGFLKSNNIELEDNILNIHVISTLLNVYAEGSQIHQNYGFNYIMGCGILKNDAVYRGMMDYSDLVKMESILDKKDFNEYSQILSKSSFGENVLVGWKKVAFMHGYI